MLVTFPGHGYRYDIAQNEPWSEFFLQFRGPIFKMWLKQGLLDPKRPIHRLQPIEHWWQRLEAIIKPHVLPEPALSLKRVCQLQEFLVDAIVTPQKETMPDHIRWLAVARAELERGFDGPVDWEALARRFDLSCHRFRKKFTALGGVPPGTYRAAKVIEHAGALLHDRSLSLKQVARQCGFYDACYFAKRFKVLTGITPAQFRRRLL